MIIEYSSNNSGGNWWLKDEDWKNLEKAGWKVDWYIPKNCYKCHGAEKNPCDTNYTNYHAKGHRFLGALATKASKEFNSEREAIEEWERITGQNAEDEGCECCGRPHSFGEK